MQESLRFTRPKQHDFGRALEQALEVRFGEFVDPIRRKTGGHPFGRQHDILAVLPRTDPDPAHAHAGDKIGARGLQVELQGCIEIAAAPPTGDPPGDCCVAVNW
jgi:hypothetical protein